MKVVVGLGNPGSKYESTRHNLGFWVIDELSRRHKIPVGTDKFKAKIGNGFFHNQKILLVKPQTFMNLSGESVALIVGYFQIDINDLIIIYDDLALETGRLRIKGKGSAGGHNGVKSIIKLLESQEFPRVRIGIGEAPSFMDTADYVLQKPSGEELEVLREATKIGADAVESWVKDGLQPTMNAYNRKS